MRKDSSLTRGHKKASLAHNLRKHWLLFVMLLPAVIYVIIFSYVPMTGIVLAFKKYQHAGGIYFSPWNGLKNFRFLIIARYLKALLSYMNQYLI